MQYQSNWRNFRTPALPYDVNGKDRLLNVVQWHFTATTIRAQFPHARPGDKYYILWSQSGDFQNDFHRSNPLFPPVDTEPGAILEKSIAGLTPDTQWTFRLVANPDVIRGEQ